MGDFIRPTLKLAVMCAGENSAWQTLAFTLRDADSDAKMIIGMINATKDSQYLICLRFPQV